MNNNIKRWDVLSFEYDTYAESILYMYLKYNIAENEDIDKGWLCLVLK